MSFFDKIEPPREPPKGPYGPSWAPPAWDRPSEAVLPARMQLDEVMGKNDRAAFVLRGLDIYPNGLLLDFEVLLNPRVEHDLHAMMMWHGTADMPRVGVEFADGRRVGHDQALGYGMMMMGAPRDENGVPTEPLLLPRGGGGGGTQYNLGQWLYPLPGPGAFKVFATWPSVGLDEAVVEIDGDEISRAARSAIELW